MNFRKIVLVLLASILAAGCGTLKQTIHEATAPAAASSQKGDAKQPVQAKQEVPRLEFRTISFAWKDGNTFTTQIDEFQRLLNDPRITPEQRKDLNRKVHAELARNLGSDLWRDGWMYPKTQKDKLDAGKPKKVTYILWNINEAVVGETTGIQVNGRNLVKSTKVLDVTRNYPAPKTMRPDGSTLGAPSKVFQVETAGDDAVGVGIVVSYDLITKDTWILICPENTDGYPFPTGNPEIQPGLWIGPNNLQYYKEIKEKRVIIPTISRK